VDPTPELPVEEPAESPPGPPAASRLKPIVPYLVLPLIFLLVAFAFSQIIGPFFYAYNYDPDYVYLFNGLNIATGQSPEHIDHPGTPLQLLLGLGIRLANLGVPAPKTAANVLANAETYLTIANLGILAAYAAVMVWVGVAVTRKTGSAVAGWLVQATPFLLGDSFLLFLRVNPEPLLLLLSLALTPLLIDDTGCDWPGGWSRRILLGFLVATGICIKITFLPVLIVVLLAERGTLNRIWHLGLVGIWSLLWTIPIWNKFGRLFGWIWGLAAKEGPYARGPVGLIGAKSFLSGLATLVLANKLFFVCLTAGVATLMVIRFQNHSNGSQRWLYARLLKCLVLGGLLQFVISAKNPQSRYLAPAMGLIGLNWAVMALALEPVSWLVNGGRKRLLLRVGTALAVIIVLAQQSMLYASTADNAAGRGEISKLTGEQRQGARIFYYGASSPVNALTFGNYFAGSQYLRIVEKLVQSGTCQSCLYNNWTGDFYSLRGRVLLKQIVEAGGPVLLQGDVLSDGEKRLLPQGTRIRELRRFKDERVYEIGLDDKVPAGAQK